MLNSVFGPHKLPLTVHEKALSSGDHVMIEEGIVDYLFSKIEVTNKFCVELGAGDGDHWSLARRLLVEKKWGGLLVEGSETWSTKLKDRYKNRSDVQVVHSFIQRENILNLFKENNVPVDFELISIDIDGIDYYVWEELEPFKPKVVLIEYNASWGGQRPFIIDYDPQFEWKEDDYFGASFASLLNLGRQKGYRLVHCTTRGDNMIFVRNDLFHLFPEVDRDEEALFQPPQYSKFGRSLNGKGHPLSPRVSSLRHRTWCRLWYYLVTPFRKLAYLSASLQGIKVK